MINDIYDLFNNKIIHVIQGMAYSWVRGKSINSIINDSIEYSNVIYINYQKFDFNRNDPEHINIKISQVISTLENDIGFKLETSVNHFFQLCKSIHGEELSGINLAILCSGITLKFMKVSNDFNLVFKVVILLKI